MGYAERIYERVKKLSDRAAEEVLDFTEFVAARHQSTAIAITDKSEKAQRRAELEKVFSKYQADLSNFKFDREEANARR
ncbi:MAG: hypothetical protein Q7S51_00600 [Gallionellaceae bacterium]|nr:hypothetical protein [Gallionellaceae bacterium]